LYSYYRVYAYSYKVEVVNNESKPVIAYLYNTNTGVSGSSLDLFAGTPYASTAVLGPATSGSSKHVFKGRVDCSKLLGSVEAETDATTRATVTGVPTDLLWLSLFAQTTSGLGTFANGVAYQISITMHTRFYGRIYNASNSLALAEARVKSLMIARDEYAHNKKIAASKKATRTDQ